MAKTVADIMTTELITLSEEDNLQALEPEMQLFGLRHLPVVDGHRLVGLLTHRDVLRLAVSSLTPDPVHASVDREKHRGTFVAAVMRRDVMTASPDMTLAEAAGVLVDQRIGCLPVVGPDHTLLGIVTEHDLLRAAVADPDSRGVGAEPFQVP